MNPARKRLGLAALENRPRLQYRRANERCAGKLSVTHAPHKNFSAPLNSGVTHIICPDLLRLFFRSVVSPKRMAVRLPPTAGCQRGAFKNRNRCALRAAISPSEQLSDGGAVIDALVGFCRSTAFESLHASKLDIGSILDRSRRGLCGRRRRRLLRCRSGAWWGRPAGGGGRHFVVLVRRL